MKFVIQRVSSASVTVDDKVIAAGHAVALQDLRFALDHFKEMVPFRCRRLDGNQRLDSVILAGVVQAHGIAADDALLLHAVKYFLHRIQSHRHPPPCRSRLWKGYPAAPTGTPPGGA
mgnify:CR=1 FL=1